MLYTYMSSYCLSETGLGLVYGPVADPEGGGRGFKPPFRGWWFFLLVSI